MAKITGKAPVVLNNLPPSNEKRSAPWAGRLIRVIEEALAAIYKVLFKCIFSTHSKSANSTKLTDIFKKEASQAAEKSKTEEIQTAEKSHQQAVDALDFIRAQKLKNTIAILRENIDRMKFLLNLPHYQSQLKEDQLTAFLTKAHTLIDDLDKINGALDEKLPAEIVSQHVSEIFKRVNEFYPNAKSMAKDLEEKSAERKNFTKLCKVLVENVSKQIKVHKTPSSDAYLQKLHETERQAWQVLQDLKAKVNIAPSA